MRGGKTVEVLNPDAEGRLVMADAIVSAAEEKPDVIVDVATLTGAQLVALGTRVYAVMSNDDGLRDELVPINRRYPLAHLLEACADYHRATRRRVSFEWALIDGVNDRPSDAAELAALPSAERLRRLTDLVRTAVAAVLRHASPEGIAVRRPFQEMGFDSLTAVEMRNQVTALTGVRPRIEVYKLEDAERAFASVMENRVRFRAVLTP